MSKHYEAIKEAIKNQTTEVLEKSLDVIGEITEKTTVEEIVVRNAIIDELENRGIRR